MSTEFFWMFVIAVLLALVVVPLFWWSFLWTLKAIALLFFGLGAVFAMSRGSRGF